MVAQALGERLGQLPAGTVVGEHLVAAGLLHGRGQGPRSGHLDLGGARVTLGLLLELVEVLGQQRPGATMVDTRGVGESPPGRLQVGAQPDSTASPRPVVVAVGPRPGKLGQVRQPERAGELTENHAHRLGVR